MRAAIALLALSASLLTGCTRNGQIFAAGALLTTAAVLSAAESANQVHARATNGFTCSGDGVQVHTAGARAYVVAGCDEVAVSCASDGTCGID